MCDGVNDSKRKKERKKVTRKLGIETPNKEGKKFVIAMVMAAPNF